MRYLKTCIQALSLSLLAVFCLFAVSLLTCFFHSSAMTKSLAQAMGVCFSQTSIIFARDLDAFSFKFLSEMFVIARGMQGES